MENLRKRTYEVVNVWGKGHSKHEEEWCQRPDVDSVCGGRVVSIKVAWTVELLCCGVMVEGDASNVGGGIPCSVQFILGLVTISAVVVGPLVALGAPIHGLPDPVLHDLAISFLRRG